MRNRICSAISVPKPQGGTGCTIKGVYGKEAIVSRLQDNLFFAIKGISAYLYHARKLGYTDPEIDTFIVRGLLRYSYQCQLLSPGVSELSSPGRGDERQNHETSQEGAHRDLRRTDINASEDWNCKGHGIFVTGHDPHALHKLLQQVESADVFVYIHPEMLPAHGYPGFRKYENLAGNVGEAWYDQRQLFAKYPMAILKTSDCFLISTEEYGDRMFTGGPIHLPGVKHIDGYDYSDVIAMARSLLELPDAPGEYVLTTGFSTGGFAGSCSQDQEVLPDGRLRRSVEKIGLLSRVRAETAQRFRRSHHGLRKIPL